MLVGLFGIFLSITAVIFLLIQLAFITVIRPCCGYDSSFAFTLMFCIGITDIVQLSIHCVSGILLFLEYRMYSLSLHSPENISTQFSKSLYEPDFSMHFTLGALMTSSWITMVIFTLFLTLHRLVWTLFPFKAANIMPPNLLKFLLCCICSFYLMYFLLNMSGMSAMTFSVKWLSWHYVVEHPWSKYCAIIDIITNYLSAFVNTIAYLFMFTFLFCKRSSILIRNYEVRITVLVFSFCFYQILCLFVWEVVEVYFIKYTDVVALTNLFMWVLWNGCSALPYLLFNSTVRELVAKRRKAICSACFSSVSDLPHENVRVPYSVNRKVSENAK